jgi:hypothetical protein
VWGWCLRHFKLIRRGNSSGSDRSSIYRERGHGHGFWIFGHSRYHRWWWWFRNRRYLWLFWFERDLWLIRNLWNSWFFRYFWILRNLR